MHETTLKQPTNQANIVLKGRPDRKVHVKEVPKSKSRWHFFSIFGVWCTMNPFHPAKLLVRNIIWALCVACVKKFVQRDQNNGYHDNAPSHTALVVRVFGEILIIIRHPHPPYSPDLTPCDFWLFPKLHSRERVSIEEIQVASKKALMAILEKILFYRKNNTFKGMKLI